ncbi:MAG TPA: response regulator [Egicoccus sp.]|nr:response regulator [Egicoccus sp.]HSK24790.1 response regulator [Egicoccus sp.]
MGGSSGDDEERYRQALVHAALRSVVHDLNNPLGTITMAAAALRSATDDVQRGELIDLIEREAMRAGSTASSAAELTAVAPAATPTTLEELVVAVGVVCRASGVEAMFVHDEADGRRFAADPTLLPRALAAFVVDAHGTPGRTEPVQVDYRLDGDALEVCIRDDGDPVPIEVVRRPFRPIPTDTQRGVHTRAVGVTVAAGRTHVRRLGGRVALEPGADRGNTVRVRLPIVAAAPTAGAQAEPDGAPPHGRRVLVVDDDRTMRNMLEVVLRRDGWHTSAAADGPAAAELVAEQPVDLVLLDLHVGTEHGPDIAAQLERRRPGVSQRVVYLSGDVPPSGRIDDRPAIAKPFVLDELYRVADAVASGAGPL